MRDTLYGGNSVAAKVSSEITSGLRTAIASALDIHESKLRFAPVAGGDISDAFRVSARGGQWFLKRNDASRADLFRAEVDGLNALQGRAEFVAPKPMASGEGDGWAYLLMDWLELRSPRAVADAERLGRAVAALHSVSERPYGWRCDNFIGLTAQDNTPTSSWADFFVKHRLRPQCAWLDARGGVTTYREALDSAEQPIRQELELAEFQPALVHGDLWAGNAAILDDGKPALFDPACYVGDPESDLAMTELFGGFSSRFYAAYHEVHPERVGYPRRRSIYQLYHVLNHALLFGGGYGTKAQTMLRALL